MPESIVEPLLSSTTSFVDKSDLIFEYESFPFAFWITRRSDPDGMPIFDTRISSLPPTPITPYNTSDPSTAFDGFPLVFEDQYLQVCMLAPRRVGLNSKPQITSALPRGTNVYGLGEIVGSSGFRRAIGTGANGTIQTHWNRDATDPLDQNMYAPVWISFHDLSDIFLYTHSYGTHPIYLEHRYNETTGKASASGVLLLKLASFRWWFIH